MHPGDNCLVLPILGDFIHRCFYLRGLFVYFKIVVGVIYTSIIKKIIIPEADQQQLIFVQIVRLTLCNSQLAEN
jgi:hypothetical protein